MTTVVLMADITGGSLARLPAHALDGVPKIAGYVTGSGGIQWSGAQLAAHPGVVRIDQSPSLGVFAGGGADVADVETGAGTPGAFAAAVKVRLALGHPGGTIYGSDSFLAAAGAALSAAGLAGHADCWLADWNLNLASASALVGQQRHGMTIRAVQWASPTSNPRTMLPGTSVTLAQANVDLSAADPTWPAGSPPPPALVGIVVFPGDATGLQARPVSSGDGGITWR